MGCPLCSKVLVIKCGFIWVACVPRLHEVLADIFINVTRFVGCATKVLSLTVNDLQETAENMSSQGW